MQSEARSPEEYIAALPEERREAMGKLRETVLAHLPEGFRERMSYGMIGYVVPHELYPPGYHCDPELPLPFLSIASQKQYIALYHMGLYAEKKLLQWFVGEYPKHVKTRLDMGKSCIRFRRPDALPLALIGELVGKMGVAEWIALYEEAVKR